MPLWTGMWISCGQAPDSSTTRPVFYMNLAEGLNTLDPAFARSRAPIWMTAQIFNGLVRLDSALHIQPSLAKSWEISPNGLTYTFLLRSEIFFHADECFGEMESRAVTAQDVVYSFTRICDPVTASTGKWIFKDKIAGLDAYLANEAPAISGFKALNDSTFQLTLTRPFPALLGLLAMPYGYVLPREAVEFYDVDFRAHPVGTGPFRFFRWNEGQSLILHRNPTYWETENDVPLPYLDAIHVQFMPSRLSAFMAFVQGKLDFIGDLDPAYKDEILTLDGQITPQYAEQYQFQLAPQLNTEYLGFQIDPDLEVAQNHPLLDLRVRKALNYAIDRPKLVRYLLNGMGIAAESGFIPAGMPGFDPEAVKGYDFDPDRARALLTEAGFPGGAGLPEITLNSTQKYAAISAFLQKSFENIGVKVRIQNLQGGALRKEIYNSRINFWRASWIADYPDGENYLSLFYTPNQAPAGPNTTHFSLTEFDDFYQQALLESNDSSRQAIYQQMDQMVMDAAPIIALYYDRSIRMTQLNISGVEGNPMNHLFLRRARKGILSAGDFD
ncbi:MAG: ABC transporter substrate-binding protein [Bacteroidota bacterium]